MLHFYVCNIKKLISNPILTTHAKSLMSEWKDC